MQETATPLDPDRPLYSEKKKETRMKFQGMGWIRRCLEDEGLGRLKIISLGSIAYSVKMVTNVSYIRNRGASESCLGLDVGLV